jgi:hypothetical protein
MLRDESRTVPIIPDWLIVRACADAWNERVARPDRGPAQRPSELRRMAIRMRGLVADWVATRARPGIALRTNSDQGVPPAKE